MPIHPRLNILAAIAAADHFIRQVQSQLGDAAYNHLGLSFRVKISYSEFERLLLKQRIKVSRKVHGHSRGLPYRMEPEDQQASK